LLDAPALETRLTPENALASIQKELTRRGWREHEFHEIKLVYTPYWVFGFDVLAEGGASPTGKTALNAFTGELSDAVPAILDRPLRKVRETPGDSKPEVEPTAISFSEVKQVAAIKVAAHVGGLKPEQVAISAVSKVYVPFYRIWADAAGDTFKFEVDACLGVPFGLEAIPKRQKNWDEATGEALDKMKTPSGWLDLFGKLVAGATDFLTGKKDDKSKFSRYVLLGVVIIALMWLVFGLQGAREKVECTLDGQYFSDAAWFGLVPGKVQARTHADGSKYLKGECIFTNAGAAKGAVIVAQVQALDAEGIILDADVLSATPELGETVGSVKAFELNWTGSSQGVKFAFEKI